MRDNFSRSLAIAVVCLIAVGCTRGKVRDGESGDGVNGVAVEIFDWRSNATDPLWVWPDRSSSPAADHTHSTQSYSIAGQGTSDDGFFIYDYTAEPCVDGVKSDSLMAERWYRFRFEKPGYFTGFYYRYHTGYTDCEVPGAYDCAQGDWVEKQDWCQDFGSFELNSKSEVHRRLPDIMVDAEELTEQTFDS